jgi:nicotinamidase/pyrazinamidase
MEVLLLIDIQYDFLPGGALEVKDGDLIIPVVNHLVQKFKLTIATQDWHPPNHKSFAVNHKGKQPGDVIKLKGLDQILWPGHCIQGSSGAELSELLDTVRIKKIFVKGTDPEIDSYSGFFDNGHLKSTGLSNYLRENNIDEVYIAGLATDYCVKFTALDSVSEGFTTIVIADATKAVNLQPDDYEKAIEEMKEAGVKIIYSKDILDG